MVKSEAYQRIYQVIRQIPAGQVATYGQIADLAGYSRLARMVGYALHAATADENLPWHRVVNARGRISLQDEDGRKMQEAMLKNEGVSINRDGVIDLKKFLWKG
ncbi:MAG: MGMT family protein [Candidatus Cloacimonetes bacterium]|nr:MGMT family protein [Candidatus Cloacimonadota bacterium]